MQKYISQIKVSDKKKYSWPFKIFKLQHMHI